MKVALVHDWLTGTRGGEKVLVELARLFPQATLFTLFHFPGTVPPILERKRIETTALQLVTAPGLDYRKLLPLFFLAAESWDLSGFDLVISSSHCVAKNARRADGAFHLSYIHTPVRYVHGLFDEYLRGRHPLVRAAAGAVRAPLARWDVATARRPDALVANSENVRRRVEALYGRSARVVPPPADTAFFTPAPRHREGYLVVSALAPYKRIDDAVEAANRASLPLTVVGFGPERQRLERLAGPTVRFAGVVSPSELRELYRGAEAVLMPGEEDFGIVPVEAMACGTPVIALGRGGAAESILPGETGILYETAGDGPLLEAIERFRPAAFEPRRLVERAALFSRERFAAGFLAALRSELAAAGRGDLLSAIAAETTA